LIHNGAEVEAHMRAESLFVTMVKDFDEMDGQDQPSILPVK
jgi:hypothetical protein